MSNRSKRARRKLPIEVKDEALGTVASATECTGLSPAAVPDEATAQSCADLYNVHPQKPDRANKAP